jgi:magnesium transporter
MPRRNPLDPRNSLRAVRVVGRFVRRQVKGAGAAPGTLVHTGEKQMERARIRAIDYDADGIREVEADSVHEVLAMRDTDSVSWINIDGLHDIDLVQHVGEHFGLHPLVLEDIVHVGQRPKEEVYPEYDAIVLPMLSWDDEGAFVREEQLSLLVGPTWILTFQERVGDSFEPVRERLRAGKGRIRIRGADYLAYALIDAVVDRYFSVLEQIGSATEELELEVLEEPGQDAMNRLHRLKRELIVLRRAVWPVRDLLNGIIRGDSGRFEEETRVFVRDVHDHTVQIIETVESLRDVVSGAIDLYLSTVSHRTNEVMKVLTIMASIFIPLTFMAGIYGMNFENMPELAVPWAYPMLWGAMIAVALAMVVYFRRKGWM